MPSTLRILFVLLALHSVSSAQHYDYKVRYGMIQAGSASLTQTVKNGILNSQLIMSSSPWLSNLWTLSDSITSRYDLNQQRMIDHQKSIHEGNYHRRYAVTFLDSNQVKINSKVKQVDWQGMVDVPSLLYQLSKSRFAEGDTLIFNLWDGRGHGELKLLVSRQLSGRSLLKPFAQRSESLLLKPLSSTEKSREHGLQLSIDLSTAYPHVPERIEIETKYGSVQMLLEKD